MVSKRLVLVAAVLISAVLTCASIFALFLWMTPSVLDVEYAISDARFAQEIHQWYIENDYHREYTGDVEWHEGWVASYDNTISILESYKSLLVRLGKTMKVVDENRN